MQKEQKRLSDAELSIMQAIWHADGPVTSGEIRQALQGNLDWSLPALMTALSRLCGKGFVNCDRSTRTKLYSALVAEADYRRLESRSFLKKLYGSSVRNFVAALCDDRALTQEDIRELRDMLDEFERENR